MFATNTGEINRVHKLLGGYAGEASAQRAVSEAPFREHSVQLFRYAGLNPKQARAYITKAIVWSIPFLGLGLIFGKSLALLGVPGALLIAYLNLKKRSFGRAEAFEKDYTAFILSLASGVRTGLDPLVAFTQSKELFSVGSEICKEIRKFNQSIERGDAEEVAVRQFASSICHPDLDLFRTAFILARKEGSSLGGCLQRLARVTRQRQSFRRKISAAVAMQKLSAFGIGGCAIVIGLMQFFSNPEGFQKALVHPMGFKIMLFATLLICGGITWMLMLTRNRL